MKIIILGQHTQNYGDFPYEIADEFQHVLKSKWNAISFFSFTSISSAEISINPSMVKNMTVNEVYSHLAEVIKLAALQIDWDIWTIADF